MSARRLLSEVSCSGSLGKTTAKCHSAIQLATLLVTLGAALGAQQAPTITSPNPASINPTIASLSPSSGQALTNIIINGSNFGSTQGTSTVTLNGVPAGLASTWTPNLIVVRVPQSATSGSVVVTVNGMASAGVPFTVVTPPTLQSVAPHTVSPLGHVTLTGSGFGASQGSGSVWLGSRMATVMSWSNTRIVAAVAVNATSGTASVRQSGGWSISIPLAVRTATITGVTPASGPPGTKVTITGSDFGSLQGEGRLWLGTADGVVESWSDTQIVAKVADDASYGQRAIQGEVEPPDADPRSRLRTNRLRITTRRVNETQAAGSGSDVQVEQNGVWSNPVPFGVTVPHIDSVSPSTASPGTAITITGSSFGAVQSSGGLVWLGSMPGQVQTWSDTEVVAVVAVHSLTGIVRVQQNGIWSNPLPFTKAGNTTILAPNLVNMDVGGIATVEASGLSGQPLTELTWTSSDSKVVRVSADRPHVLSAIGPGHATVTAGTASVDVTVSAGRMPKGTAVWMNPGNGSGVVAIISAVVGPKGVADVFAFQNDRTVQAITADGTTAWTADVSLAVSPRYVVADCSNGLIVRENVKGDQFDTLVKLDALTGQPTTLYTAPASSGGVDVPWVDFDGTVVTLLRAKDGHVVSVVGIDGNTGAQKFNVPIPVNPSTALVGSMIIYGDVYVPYVFPVAPSVYQLNLLRIGMSGAADDIKVWQWAGGPYDRIPVETGLLPNTDEGVIVTWATDVGSGIALVTGTNVTVLDGPHLPGGQMVLPCLQHEDGSYIGASFVPDGKGGSTQVMVGFDLSGNLLWSIPGYYDPRVALAEGNHIATDDFGRAYTFNSNGSATGQMRDLPMYSWLAHMYRTGNEPGPVARLNNPALDVDLSVVVFR